jgi:hypothetical protein
VSEPIPTFGFKLDRKSSHRYAGPVDNYEAFAHWAAKRQRAVRSNRHQTGRSQWAKRSLAR